MTKAVIDPGICGMVTNVECQVQEDGVHVRLKVDSPCQHIRAMVESVGEVVDSWELCLKRPGEGPFFAFASQNFPPDACCPTLPGIIKCVRAEAGLALKKDTSLTFLE